MSTFVNIPLSVSVLFNTIEYGWIQNHSKDDVAKLLEIGCYDSFQPLVWKRIHKIINAAITKPKRHVALTIMRK